MLRIPQKLLHLMAAVFTALIFVIDCLVYLIKTDLSFLVISLSSLRIIIILLLVGSWLLIIRQNFHITQLPLSQKLIRLSVFLGVNYALLAVLTLLLNPSYTPGSPPAFQNFDSLIHANIAGLSALITLPPILLILKELIFYKQRRTTRLYFNLFLFLLVISSVFVLFYDRALPFGFDESNYQGSIISVSLIVVSLLLAFRNDWITYLPRRQKIIFFSAGIFVYGSIVTLWDFVYATHLEAYGLLVANFGYIMWILLMLYGGLAILTLLVHLPTARAVDRKLKEVNSLYTFARVLNSELNYQKLTQLITQLTQQFLESDTAWLQEYDPVNHKFKILSHIQLSQQQILDNPFRNPDGLNREILSERKAFLINDISQIPEMRAVQKWKAGSRALIAAPLYSNRDQLMGVLYATKNQSYSFDIDDVSLLEGFANQSAIALENASLLHESIERERLEQELRVARDVQLKLLPQTMPDIEGLDIASYFLTAYEVGGDYFDFIEFTDGCAGIIIGDVSGKGTSAAFYMAEFKGVIQTLGRTLSDPLEMISQANHVIFRNTERQSFITAIIGKYNPKSGLFSFVRAGHNPVLHCSEACPEGRFLQPPGLGIGLDRGPIFDELIRVEDVQLKPGDSLILFTDGLVEARSNGGEEFGEERLQNIVSGCNSSNADETRDLILQGFTDFVGNMALHDDLTMIVLKVNA